MPGAAVHMEAMLWRGSVWSPCGAAVSDLSLCDVVSRASGGREARMAWAKGREIRYVATGGILIPALGSHPGASGTVALRVQCPPVPTTGLGWTPRACAALDKHSVDSVGTVGMGSWSVRAGASGDSPALGVLHPPEAARKMGYVSTQQGPRISSCRNPP